ncbi:MAG: bacteriohemerythrin [Thermincolia bacterium]
MAIQWTQDLAVGVNEIDNQHKELFAKVNKLIEAMHQGKGKEEIGEVVSFLEKYVIEHFGTEEKLMTKHNYPNFTAHKGHHNEFIKDFNALKKEFEFKAANTFLVIQIQRRVVDWLIDHIGKVDKELGKFLQNK